MGKTKVIKSNKCGNCGTELAQSEKVCPACGTKIKKSILKKWWFWGIVLIVLVVGFSSRTGQDSEADIEKQEVQIKSSQEVDKEESIDKMVQQSSEPASGEDAKQQDSSEQDIEKEPEVDDDVSDMTQNKVTMTISQQNALRSAESYLDFAGFSYLGLINQLEYEQYSHEDAVFAADHCGADWNEQALKSAQSYLNFTAFSYSGLIEQLEYEKFTTEEATYAADHCGADWNEQAAKSAKNYLDFSSFSREGLIDQLEYEGFTYEQAVYGVEQNGY